MRFPLSRTAALMLLPLVFGLFAGCGGMTTKRTSYEPEEFGSTNTHTRIYEASEAQTCEAARRALLSQGYMISATGSSDLVTGRKSFQPAAEVHVEVEFRVVCAKESKSGGPPSTVAFASALQDRYGMRKVNNSASVGVGAFGSLSLPFSASDDALVKVASETLTDERFYERFFALIERFLPEAAEGAESTPVQASPVVDPVSVPAANLPSEPPARAVPLSPTRG